MAKAYNKKLFMFAFDSNSEFVAEMLDDVINIYEDLYRNFPSDKCFEYGFMTFLCSVPKANPSLSKQIGQGYKD